MFNFLKSLFNPRYFYSSAVALALATSACATSKNLNDELETQKKELTQKMGNLTKARRERDYIDIETKQKSLSGFISSMTDRIIPELEEIKRRYENPSSHNTLELRTVIEDRKILANFLEESKGKHKEILVDALGEENYEQFVLELENLTKAVGKVGKKLLQEDLPLIRQEIDVLLGASPQPAG